MLATKGLTGGSYLRYVRITWSVKSSSSLKCCNWFIVRCCPPVLSFVATSRPIAMSLTRWRLIYFILFILFDSNVSCRRVPAVVWSLSGGGESPPQNKERTGWRAVALLHSEHIESTQSQSSIYNTRWNFSLTPISPLSLRVATQAEADSIDALENYRGKCEPTFLFYGVSWTVNGSCHPSQLALQSEVYSDCIITGYIITGTVGAQNCSYICNGNNVFQRFPRYPTVLISLFNHWCKERMK